MDIVSEIANSADDNNDVDDDDGGECRHKRITKEENENYVCMMIIARRLLRTYVIHVVIMYSHLQSSRFGRRTILLMLFVGPCKVCVCVGGFAREILIKHFRFSPFSFT